MRIQQVIRTSYIYSCIDYLYNPCTYFCMSIRSMLIYTCLYDPCLLIHVYKNDMFTYLSNKPHISVFFYTIQACLYNIHFYKLDLHNCLIHPYKCLYLFLQSMLVYTIYISINST